MVTINYRSAEIKLAESVYDPAEDSYLLADAAVGHAEDGMRVLEIGTGTGFVSAVVQANRKVKLIATEINPYAAACARSNGIEVIRTDMFAGIRKDRQFDLIVFNPPYLPTSEDEKVPGWLNYAFDGGIDGRTSIRYFSEEVSGYLAPGGTILLLVSSLTGIKEVSERMQAYGLKTKIVASVKCSFEELVVIKATGHSCPGEQK